MFNFTQPSRKIDVQPTQPLLKASTFEAKGSSQKKKQIKVELNLSQLELSKILEAPGNPLAERVYTAINRKAPYQWLRTAAILEANGWRASLTDLVSQRGSSIDAIKRQIGEFNSAVGCSIGVTLYVDAQGVVKLADEDVAGQLRDNAIMERARPAIERTKRRLACAQVRGTVASLPLPEGSTAAQLLLFWSSNQKQLKGAQ